MGIKGWSLRDGILEGEGWRRVILGGLVGGCREVSRAWPSARMQEWGDRGCREPVHVGYWGGGGVSLGYSNIPLGGCAARCLATSWPGPVSPPTLIPPIQQLVLALPPPVSFTYVNDNPQEVIVGE